MEIPTRLTFPTYRFRGILSRPTIPLSQGDYKQSAPIIHDWLLYYLKQTSTNRLEVSMPGPMDAARI